MSKPNREPALDPITDEIIGGGIAVHRALGPGLLESTYEACLCLELVARGMRVQRQVGVPVIYRGQTLDVGYRVDLLIEGVVVVEVKSVTRVAPIAEAQVLTYLKLLRLERGLLCNFNVTLFRDGITRLVR
jgi:GxxExxY protein